MRSRLVLFAAVLAALSQPVLSSASTAALSEPRDEASTSEACTFEGNQDFYGIGVRLGFYLQWMAGLIAFTLNPENCSEQADVQSIFLLANFIALLVLQSKMAASTNVVVPILLFYTFFGGSVNVVTSATVSWQEWRRNPRLTKKVSLIVRQAVVQLTLFMLLVYSFYFWCTGLRRFAQYPPECSGGTFIFPSAHRTTVDHTTVGSVFGLLLLAVLLIAVYLIAHRRLWGDYGWVEILLSRFRSRRGRTSQRRDQNELGVPWDKDQIYWTIAGASLIAFAMLYSIIGIELTLVRNRVTGVNNLELTSQLIPFIIGIASLPVSIWSAFENWNGWKMSRQHLIPQSEQESMQRQKSEAP